MKNCKLDDERVLANRSDGLGLNRGAGAHTRVLVETIAGSVKEGAVKSVACSVNNGRSVLTAPVWPSYTFGNKSLYVLSFKRKLQ
jgi:hypothetical protein